MRRRTDAGRECSCIVPELLERRQLLSSSFGLTPEQLATVGRNQHPHSAAIFEDFTGDGEKDMVYGAGRNLFLARGLGAGEFDRPVLAGSANADIGLLAAGDFDGDNRLDLASAGDVDGLSFVVRMFLNTGDGEFRRERARKVSGSVESLTVADTEGSLTPEILTTSRSTLVTLDNQESGRIAAADGPRLNTSPQSVGSLPSEVLTVFSTGPGVIRAPRFVFSATEITAPAVGKIKGLGPAEIIIGSYTNLLNFVPLDGSFVPPPPRVSVLRYAGDGGYAEVASMAVQGVPTSVAIGDLNDDRLPDIAVSTTSQGADGVRGVVTGTVFSVLQTPNKALTDVITLAEPVALYTREFAALIGFRPQRPLVPEVRILGITDLNTDGKIDLALSTTDEINYPRAKFERTTEFVLLPGVSDRFADPAVLNLPLTLKRVVTTGSPLTDAAPDRLPVFALADTTLDGRADLIVWNRVSFTGPSRLQVFRNTVAPKAPLIQSVKGGIITAFNPQPGQDFPPPGFTVYSGAATVLNPEVMRAGSIARVTVYFDSNGNGVLDSADEVAAQAEQVQPQPAPTADQSTWSFQVALDANVLPGTLLVEAVGSNGLKHVVLVNTNPFVFQPAA